MPDTFSLATDTADSLARLRDEIDLKIHLASMDATDAWKSLKPDLERIEQNLRQLVSKQQKNVKSPATIALDEAGLQMHLALMNAKTAWEKLEPRISPIIAHLGKAGDAFNKAVAEETRGSEERRQKVKTALERAASEFRIAANETVQEVKDRVEIFRTNLAQAKQARTEQRAAKGGM